VRITAAHRRRGHLHVFVRRTSTLLVWGLLAAAGQAYLNGMIPSRQRATILSVDSLMTSTGGVVAQPALGRAADVRGYPASLLLAAGLSALVLPFVWASRQARHPAYTA
jgi:MFS family permease